MDNIKKIIIAIIVLIIIIVAIIEIIIYTQKKSVENGIIDEQGNYYETYEENENANKITKVDNYVEYLRVKDCIDSYQMFSADLLYIDTGEIDKDLVYNRILSIIPDFVKDSMNLNTNNLYENIGVSNKLLRINNLYSAMQTITQYAYIVEGSFIDTENKIKPETFQIIVIIDSINNTFYIIPEKYIEKQDLNLQEGNNLKIYNEEEIPDNTYNKYQTKAYRNEDMAKDYLNQYRLSMQYDPEYLYSKLDEQYKQKRFGSYEEFTKYVEKNKTRISKEQLSKFKVNNYDNYKEYILIDKNDNYYIIRETAIGEYTLILDTYTIALPEYVEKYNQASETQKVANCINRFIKILNDENYNLAYSLLADSFKNNYFKTQLEFEKYAKQYLIGKENISFYEYKNEGNMYSTYSVELSNKQNENDKISKTFVVKLNEGTEFELSFNVN